MRRLFPFPLPVILFLALSVHAAAIPHCPSSGSDSQRLLLIDPPSYSTIALPLNVTACVPQRLLRHASSGSVKASLQLTINTMVDAESDVSPSVTFPINKELPDDFIVGAPFEWCVYFVTTEAGARRRIGRDYPCIITSVSSAAPPHPCPPPPPSSLAQRLRSPRGGPRTINVNVCYCALNAGMQRDESLTFERRYTQDSVTDWLQAHSHLQQQQQQQQSCEGSSMLANVLKILHEETSSDPSEWDSCFDATTAADGRAAAAAAVAAHARLEKHLNFSLGQGHSGQLAFLTLTLAALSRDAASMCQTGFNSGTAR